MKNDLTDRQKSILDYIEQYRENTGFPPTIREIAKQFGIASTFGVKRHLDALIKKGYLSKEQNASRGLTLNKDSELTKGYRNEEEYVKIPVVGRVAAGFPILAIENLEGSLVLDPSMIKKNSECFALKVKGNSMINAGIFEDDLVIVYPTAEALNGEIVVAMLEGEVTVKTFEMKNNKIRLLPHNDDYKPIELNNLEDFSIIGRVIGVYRSLN